MQPGAVKRTWRGGRYQAHTEEWPFLSAHGAVPQCGKDEVVHRHDTHEDSHGEVEACK